MLANLLSLLLMLVTPKITAFTLLYFILFYFIIKLQPIEIAVTMG